MISLFHAKDAAAMLQRIDHLTADSQPLWGKMTVSQMLYHCQRPFEVAKGTLPLGWGVLGRLFGGMAKRKLMSDEPFVRNLPTLHAFKPPASPMFRQEQQKLKTLIQDFSLQGEGFIVNKLHPFFGRLSVEEWERLLFKHLDHHLNQFGV